MRLLRACMHARPLAPLPPRPAASCAAAAARPAASLSSRAPLDFRAPRGRAPVLLRRRRFKLCTGKKSVKPFHMTRARRMAGRGLGVLGVGNTKGCAMHHIISKRTVGGGTIPNGECEGKGYRRAATLGVERGKWNHTRTCHHRLCFSLLPILYRSSSLITLSLSLSPPKAKKMAPHSPSQPAST